jgi:hypothetical protein
LTGHNYAKSTGKTHINLGTHYSLWRLRFSMTDLKKRKAPDGTERTWTADSPLTEFVSAQYPDAPKEKVDALINA